ncbi:hypothetical protein LVJ82_01420 [Vitreoscilla massiliensis]|uniref:Uncharacterized protein n=1 Tax=Vitreoscilla massiliensis TaxID=1689272 RepID=A0ABY4E2Q9_9NEIS|nr:hypothetical protein [Vitreoscilla massiliensis]UOO89675.1 hypothetical protein LVJ82_01420 [Vitreoscilla massiliensis]
MNLDKEMEAHKFNLQQILHAGFKSYPKNESAIYAILNSAHLLSLIESIRNDEINVDKIPELKTEILEYYKVSGIKY